MKTDELIKTLSEDTTPAKPLWRDAGLFGLAGLAAAAILFLATIGIRPDFYQAAETGAFQFKMMVFAAIAVMTAVDFYRLMRPGARQVPYGVIAGAVILAATAFYQVVSAPSDQWQAHLFSGNWGSCLMSIPFLAVCPLVATVLAMRNAAPASPTIAGLAAGGVAASISATIYATHCPADSPIFFAVWYSIAAMTVLAGGTLAGRQALRW